MKKFALAFLLAVMFAIPVKNHAALPTIDPGLISDPLQIDYDLIDPEINLPEADLINPDLINPDLVLDPGIIIPDWDFLLNACSVQKVTNNSTGDFNPSLQGGTVAWTRGDSLNYSVYKWDISESTSSAEEVPDSGFALGGHPTVYNGTIAWGKFSNIILYDGSSNVEVEDNSANDKIYAFPALFQNGIVYNRVNTSDLTNFELVYRSGVSESIIHTGNDYSHPSAYNGKVAFQDYDGNDYEIYYWDGSSKQQVTNNNYDDKFPSLYNGKIAWQGNKDGDWDIFYWDGSSTVNQFSRSGDDENPSLYNGKLVWQGTDGNDKEIYQWDGTSITQVTSNSIDDSNPSYDNGYLAWEGNDGDSEIYFCNLDSTDVPLPTSQDAYSYLPSELPSVTGTDPANMKPLGVGDVSGGTLNLKAEFPKYTGAVDIYIGIYAPAIDPEILIVLSDNSLQKVSEGLEPWRSNVTGSINSVSLYGDLNVSDLPSGNYTFYILVSPAGTLTNFYLWETSVSF